MSWDLFIEIVSTVFETLYKHSEPKISHNLFFAVDIEIEKSSNRAWFFTDCWEVEFFFFFSSFSLEIKILFVNSIFVMRRKI